MKTLEGLLGDMEDFKIEEEHSLAKILPQNSYLLETLP